MRRKDITPRILAMILAAASLFSAVPAAVYADETSLAQEIQLLAEEIQTETETETQPEVVETEAETTETQPEVSQTETETQPETQPETEETTEEPVIPQTTEEEPQTTSETEAPSETEPQETTEESTEETETETVEESTEETTETEEETTEEETEETTSSEENEIEEENSVEREIAAKAIEAAKDKVSQLLENLLDTVPGGSYVKSLFDCVSGLLGDEFIGSIWGEEADVSAKLEEMMNKLKDIERELSDLSGIVIDLQNTTFKEAINEVHRITKQYIGSLISYNKAVADLKKAPAGSDTTDLEKAVENTKQELVMLAKNEEITKTLKEKLGKVIQYMNNDTVDGSKDNPFLVNLDARKKDSSIHYGQEIYEKCHNDFDLKVWKFFAEGLSLYTACTQINASVATNPEDMQKAAGDLAQMLTGSRDGSESYIGESVIAALKVYNEKVVPEEKKAVGEWRPDIGDVTAFKCLTSAKIGAYGEKFETTDGSFNTEALMYINNFAKNSYGSYLKKLKKLIKEEYLKNYSDLELRTFIKEKIGVDVPENSKYLVLSNVLYHYGNCMDVIALDETNTSIIEMSFDGASRSDLCFFTEKINPAANSVVDVTFEQSGYQSTYAFDNFEDAWNFTGDFTSITYKLNQDITAKKNGDEKFTRFGKGKNFTTEENGKTVYGAMVVTRDITIDLNRHTINRNQDRAVAGGSVFIMTSYSSLTLKNGTVTGGNTTGNGGVVAATDHSDVTLDYMILQGNHADGCGGAVYYGYGLDYVIKDSLIKENTAGKSGGGIYCRAYQSFETSDIVAKGVIGIWGNTANGREDNAALNDLPTKKTIFKLDDSFSGDSRIGVNSSTTDKWLDITNGTDVVKRCGSVFFSDRSDRAIEIYQGTFTRQWYVRIKKA